MKETVLSSYYGAQEIPEVNSLAEIEEAGTYVEPVTAYGVSEISRLYPSAVLFEGADGRIYYGMLCGEFAGGDR